MSAPDGSGPETNPPTLDLRRGVVSVVVALFVGAVLIWSFGRATGFSELEEAFDGASWPWLALCALGQALVFAGYAGVFRSTVAFEGGTAVAPRAAFEVVMASFALTQVVATGGAAGLAFTYWALRRLDFEPRDALVRLIGMNTAVYFVFGTLGWLGAVTAVLTDAPAAMALPWIVGVPVVMATARWFTAPNRHGRWSMQRGRGLRTALGTGVHAAAWARRVIATEQGRPLLGWALVYWVGDLLSLWAALRAFGWNLSPVILVLAYVTGYLAQLIPVPFLATGGVDAATTLTLSAVGVPVEIALLGVVAHRVFAFWLPIAPGVFFAATLVRRGGPTTVPAT